MVSNGTWALLACLMVREIRRRLPFRSCLQRKRGVLDLTGSQELSN